MIELICTTYCPDCNIRLTIYYVLNEQRYYGECSKCKEWFYAEPEKRWEIH